MHINYLWLLSYYNSRVRVAATKVRKASNIYYLALYKEGFPGSSAGKKSTCNARDPDLIPGSGRSPGEGNATTPVFLPGESHGQRSLAGHRSWGHRESDMAEQLSRHASFTKNVC